LGTDVRPFWDSLFIIFFKNKMKNPIFLIYTVLAFLLGALYIAPPIEFCNSIGSDVVHFLSVLCYLFLFVWLFYKIRKIARKSIKWLTFGLTILLFIPHLLTGFGSIVSPEWRDVSIYTDKNGRQIVQQWQGAGSSIYDYRDRKIIKTFRDFRIVVPCGDEYKNGDWKETVIEKEW
jgi:hypothetical protein